MTSNLMSLAMSASHPVAAIAADLDAMTGNDKFSDVHTLRQAAQNLPLTIRDQTFTLRR